MNAKGKRQKAKGWGMGDERKRQKAEGKLGRGDGEMGESDVFRSLFSVSRPFSALRSRFPVFSPLSDFRPSIRMGMFCFSQWRINRFLGVFCFLEIA
jgi:hypothetical protein